MAESDLRNPLPRTIALGDIHGCSLALKAIVDEIAPKPDDMIILLGDYVDRGIDSRGVLDYLIKLQDRCHLIPILGNHDQMMLEAQKGRSEFQFWLINGGSSALDSYGSSKKIELIPPSHFEFLQSCRSYYESESYIFTHANYKPELPMEKQTDRTLRWLSLRVSGPPKKHCSGKTVFVGHSPQPEVLDIGHFVCIDTNCYKGGWLTAIDVETRQIWQANERGELRTSR
jgi:serine/threonine protein phosphatase 1